eukprot:GILJ01004919.1.p1 GENE.GILJ01004919.1~~GILJ01004919.1.p1  ORF type:complete len:238 (+),score=23.42 GILJ01004919.1:41-754(+)
MKTFFAVLGVIALLLSVSTAVRPVKKAGKMGGDEPFDLEQTMKQLQGLLSELDLGSAGFNIPIHGKYCGPGHGDGTYTTPPIDEVDRLCLEHDRCYDARYQDCGCDAMFIKGLEELKDPAMSFVASTMSLWFASSPCTCHVNPLTEDAIKAMKVAELRKLMTAHDIDYRHCIEKQEFLDLALAHLAGKSPKPSNLKDPSKLTKARCVAPKLEPLKAILSNTIGASDAEEDVVLSDEL